MTKKPLGVIKNIVETVGTGISYAYEDLVFLEHNGFLLQFTDNDRELMVHTNSEADETVISRDIGRLIEAGLTHNIFFVHGNVYTLSQEDDENIRIEFNQAA